MTLKEILEKTYWKFDRRSDNQINYYGVDAGNIHLKLMFTDNDLESDTCRMNHVEVEKLLIVILEGVYAVMR
jgi:hypothetical protein